jgi:uncharacterized RDD family membrane protein YckC
MKCPKCDYLGFETGDRCRHCGYDFSLATRVPDPADVSLRVSEEAPVAAVGDLWIREQGTEAAGIEDGGASVRVAAAGAYPLFPSIRPGDDEPLIRVPREPRAPLAVRRPAELPRIRPTPRGVRVPESSPVLDFVGEDLREAPAPSPAPVEPPRAARAHAPVPTRKAGVSSLGRRALAAAVDHAILVGVDAVVLACTLRMTGLSLAEWTLLPQAPLVAFLAMIKVAYFSAFTAMGGQTIGKMAVGIRVVGDGSPRVEPARALRRTITGVVSLLPLGAGFLPALLGVERRTLHDRVAGTRVVDLPSA